MHAPTSTALAPTTAASHAPGRRRASWLLVPAAALGVAAASFTGVVLGVGVYAFGLAIAHGGVVESARLDAFGDALGARLGPALRVWFAFLVARRLACAGLLGAIGAVTFAAALVVLAAAIAALFGDAPVAADAALAVATFAAVFGGQWFGRRDHEHAARERMLLARLRDAATHGDVARALAEHAPGVAFDLWTARQAPSRWLASSDGVATTTAPSAENWIACGEEHALVLRRSDVRARARLAAVADAVGVALDRVALQVDARQRGASEARERLAGDIHDTIAQDLGGASTHLEAGAVALPERGAAAEHLRIAAGGVRRALAELRNLVWALRPPERRLPLVEAMRRTADRVSAAASLAVHADLPDAAPPLSADGELCVLRALQEGLHNAARHGGAERVEVTLAVDDAAVVLTVDDDGVGLRAAASAEPGVPVAAPVLPRAAAKDRAAEDRADGDRPTTNDAGRDPPPGPDGGHGLSLLRARAARLGGTLALTSSPVGGCRLTLRLPTLHARP